MDIVDDHIVGDADDRERYRIRDRHLYGTGESWNPFAIGYDQRRRRADQSASERADISDGPAARAIKPQSHHQEVDRAPGSTVREASTTFESPTL